MLPRVNCPTGWASVVRLKPCSGKSTDSANWLKGSLGFSGLGSSGGGCWVSESPGPAGWGSAGFGSFGVTGVSAAGESGSGVASDMLELSGTVSAGWDSPAWPGPGSSATDSAAPGCCASSPGLSESAGLSGVAAPSLATVSGSKVVRFSMTSNSGSQFSPSSVTSDTGVSSAESSLPDVSPDEVSLEAVCEPASPSASEPEPEKANIRHTSKTTAAKPPSEPKIIIFWRLGSFSCLPMPDPSPELEPLPELEAPSPPTLMPMAACAASSAGSASITGKPSSPASHVERTSLTSAADANRSAGSLAIIFRQISAKLSGTSGRISVISVGWEVWCLRIRSCRVPSGKGGRPVNRK